MTNTPPPEVKITSYAPGELEGEEELLESMEQFSRDSDYLDQHFEELVERYPDEFVAIHDGEVIGHDKDPFKLADRVRNEGRASFLLEYLPREPLDLIL